MNKFKMLSKRTLALCTVVCFALGVGSFVSCSDSWDDHYDTNRSITGTQTLWEQISSNPQLSNFAQILKAVKVPTGHKLTSVSYADVFNGDQTYTVWAPVISDAERDSILALCQTSEGNYIVGKTFVKNHFTRYNHSLSPTTDEQITLLNNKVKLLNGSTMKMGESSITTSNLVATNGLLYVISGSIPYLYGIYEYVTTMSDLSELGDFLSSQQKEKLNEKASVPYGIVDGQTVYIDSVMYETNALLDKIGYINAEDSDYWMIAPTNTAWDKIYATTKKYFNYAYLPTADSLQQYWAKHAIVNDLIFNCNSQHSVQDSLISNQYNQWEPKYHVFYHPYASGGIMSGADAGTKCSNGKVFRVNEWPFDITKVFFTPIKVEGEYENNITDYSLCTFNMRSALGDSISSNGYLDLVPSTSSANPTVTFQIPNTLSGKYDVCVVCLPKTVYDENSTDVRPYQFKAVISYANELGITKSYNCGNKAFNNNPLVVDTVCVAPAFQFPTCNYNQENVTASLKVSVQISSKQTSSFSREMYIDCIYLRPVKDDN
jgi:uncharacterized surface protein with fasciclin (FAS1) repeats